METIRYCGNKSKIIPKILDLIPKECKNILDAFSGTTSVSQALKINNYNVDCNDISYYSKVFGDTYIVNNNQYTSEKINYLNNLKLKKSWFYNNYNFLEKKPFSDLNLQKLDSIRNQIDIISENEMEKSILLTSLINALDKVFNGIGHQVSYLRQFSKSSLKPLKLELPIFIEGKGSYNSTQQDIFTIKKQYDLIYLDAPYGTNNTQQTSRVRYNSYYHLWNTIVKNDKPKLFGKVGRPLSTKDSSISVFESTDIGVVYNSFVDLLELNTKYFIFSYSNKSKIQIQDLIKLFNKKLIKTLSFEHKENNQKNLITTSKYVIDTNKNLEYLFLLKNN